MQPLPLALPVPIDATLQAQQVPGNATNAGDAEATSAIAAQVVGHVPGAKPAVTDATPSDVQPAGTRATPHRADLQPASMQSVSDQPDTSQSTTTQATTPAATPLALHPLPGNVATAPAATPASAAPASVLNAHVPSPAAQVAPALVAMGHAPDGAQRLTMRLAPPELGQVQIHIDRPPDAPARVDITVEKTETLTLLLRDQPQLQHALDQAGVPPEGRSVTFHVVAPEPPTRVDATSIPSPSGAASNGLAGEYSQGASRQGGHPAQQQQTAASGSDEAAQADAAPPPWPWARWSRAGLDITA
jgi:flagellar hook-length control protein FliK